MLRWTLFLGLSTLFVAPIFAGKRLENIIRVAFLANGILHLLRGVDYILNMTLLVFLSINLGMGAAIMVAAISLVMLFQKIEKKDT